MDPGTTTGAPCDFGLSEKPARTAIGRLSDLLEPPGKSQFVDRTVLALWDVYATLRGAFARLGEVRPGGSRPPSGPPEVIGGSPRYDSAFFHHHLTQQLLPFWELRSPDRECGGFLHHFDEKGEAYDATRKVSAMQGRIIYAFSVGYDLTNRKEFLEAAEQGVEFLIEHFWDEDFGGWYYITDRQGVSRHTDKYLVNQAYVLKGLAEYYRVTRSPVAHDYITRTCALIKEKAWDGRHGGYYERCGPDWVQISSKKSICVHLDLLSAMMVMFETDGEPAFHGEMKRLADLIVREMADPVYGCVLEVFHRDWRYNPLRTGDRIEIGHNVKAAWLFLRLYQMENDARYLQFAKRLLDYSLEHGWDTKHGGFYQYLYRNGTVASHEKLWWPETDGMLALLLMSNVTSEQKYFDYFLQLAAFCFAHLVDTADGEWFTSCHADGTVKDPRKAYDWKSCHHSVQSSRYAHQYLKEREASVI